MEGFLRDGHKHLHDYDILISAETFSLEGPSPNLLTAVTLTTTLLLKYPSGTDGALNIKEVFGLST